MSLVFSFPLPYWIIEETSPPPLWLICPPLNGPRHALAIWTEERFTVLSTTFIGAFRQQVSAVYARCVAHESIPAFGSNFVVSPVNLPPKLSSVNRQSWHSLSFLPPVFPSTGNRQIDLLFLAWKSPTSGMVLPGTSIATRCFAPRCRQMTMFFCILPPCKRVRLTNGTFWRRNTNKKQVSMWCRFLGNTVKLVSTSSRIRYLASVCPASDLIPARILVNSSGLRFVSFGGETWPHIVSNASTQADIAP